MKLPSTFIDILFQLPKKHNVAFAVVTTAAIYLNVKS